MTGGRALAMDTSELAAREAVRELVARYAHLVDRGRIEELVLLFAADGVLEANDRPPARGREAIRTFLTDTWAQLAAETTHPLIRHHVSSLTIHVTGPDAATAASYFVPVTGRGPDHWGRDRDRLVRVDDGWLFAHRRVRTDGHAPGSWGGRSPGGASP